MKPANIIHIESLDYGWCDNDEVMLHACFQLLCNCIDEENLLNGHTDWEYDDEHKNAKKELTDLYNWWQERKDQCCNIDPLDKNQYSTDNEKLIKLISLRHWMWT